MYGTSPLLRSWIERCRTRRGARGLDDAETVSLAELRRSLGKTQAEVARAMGISQSDYSKLERRRDVRVSTLRSAAAALGGSLHLVVRTPDRGFILAFEDQA
jgi:transcriptional regulator with XRE-family HTH domain